MAVRTVFIGTVEFSWHMLDELLKQEAGVVAVYSVAREHAGGISDWRDLSDLTTPKGIEHHEVRKVATPGNVARIRELKPDAVFVMGISQLLPQELLAIPRLGTIGSHPALLPRNRGRAAIPWHILNGEAEGGLTFFLVGEGVDDGPIVSQRRFHVTLRDTATTLHRKVIAAGREMMAEVVPMLRQGRIDATPQDEATATYLPRRRPEDGRIDWKQNARKTYDLVRATTEPYPGAFCYLGAHKLIVWEAGFSHEPTEARSGEVVRISDRGVEVASGAGLVVLRTVQLGGDKENALDVFVRAGIELGAFLT